MIKRALAFILVFLLLASLSACGKVGQSNIATVSGDGVLSPLPTYIEEPTPIEEEPVIEETPPEAPKNALLSKEEIEEKMGEISALSPDLIQWGPGLRFMEDNRPEACVYLQETYKDYAVDFLREGEEHKGKVYLTFDEGYENGYTSSILDTLNEKGVSAVFFVTMPYVKSNPELVQRMIDEGHIIGNHSVNHKDMSTISLSEQYDEVAGLHEYMEKEFDYHMSLWRFPTGAFTLQNVELIKSMGLRSVFWSFAYADWDANSQPDPTEAFDRITGHIHDGEIFLLHAVSSTNAQILPAVIDKVRAEGFQFEKYE